MSSRYWVVTLLAAAFTSAAVAVADEQGAAALKNPAALKETAPATFKANFDTSVGAFVIEVHRDWAPQGADRFYNLVKNGFYDGARFFRVMSGFMVQFGINGDPAVNTAWRAARIPDDPVKQSNKRGYVTFAHGGPGSRTTQVFINFGDNGSLDAQGFPAFGQVTSGMAVVDKINSEYGDGPPRGRGPDQGRVQTEGNAYLMKDFPKLDYIKKATIAQ
ncbi:MAG TPA: peptidylprolyl isomerase [Vicinamibacterales bacterium]|nr:peptidylprolyl isomerase [Vicinamibacterales bacterium]